MTSRQLLILTLSLVLASPALADSYSAISNTAMSITGDIEFDDFGITFENGKKITFDQLVGDTFVVGGETVNASVYSIADPEDPVLLNDNRLCGEPVTYVASWATQARQRSRSSRRRTCLRATRICARPTPTSKTRGRGTSPDRPTRDQQATWSISMGRRSMRAKAARM
ncbi:hypothetical protein [Shinella sp.]|uniref:hypothetical protein n=1 Tax=Shinella sp. TaxID=1870904 RepID=UPI00289E8D7B|nr:hypothetical protein [Shinella sp.]